MLYLTRNNQTRVIDKTLAVAYGSNIKKVPYTREQIIFVNVMIASRFYSLPVLFLFRKTILRTHRYEYGNIFKTDSDELCSPFSRQL
jgi:hypothetical protein